MTPIASPLNIIDFAIMNLEFNFIQPQGRNEIDFKKHFNEYDLDIDFGMHGNDIIQVFIKAKINNGVKKLPGYSIMAEAACIYKFDKTIEISQDAKNSVEGFSTIYIALNFLRGFISQLTANAPLGRYILPSVDLNDLIAKKKAQLVSEEKKKKMKEKK